MMLPLVQGWGSTDGFFIFIFIFFIFAFLFNLSIYRSFFFLPFLFFYMEVLLRLSLPFTKKTFRRRPFLLTIFSSYPEVRGPKKMRKGKKERRWGKRKENE
ncbi:hypothetical protein IE53DRAFT_204967 [Violaceomyces palustris]|uniref:Uncharacterized protein n=1 Tax=Violaceomyces palustris TaxID=1673888 RepID=A0ACD0NR21_9BASI|nr:hypothetical protein IE53DRAFT_204967 [Violaceomyces palustris]